MSEHHSVIIIGAGVSGLTIAWRLQQQEQDVIVLEARDRSGGRILSGNIEGHANNGVDLGPSWVWPQLQPRLHKLFTELDIKLFNQFTDGDMLFESKEAQIERYAGESGHDQSYRISGGSHTLIDVLVSQLAADSIHLNTQVISINQQSLVIQTFHKGEPRQYSADKIILTLPPRLMAQTIEFIPPVDNELLQSWKNIPTWMAGHCKAVFIYRKPFWREQGLSGEVFSHYGPLTEIYDASPADEAYFALTSFVGLSAQQRQQTGIEALKKLCLQQLHRLFGDESSEVIDIQLKDWRMECYTTTEIDLISASGHPQYPETSARSMANKKIIFAGTETARQYGGYLEGALESVEEALGMLQA